MKPKHLLALSVFAGLAAVVLARVQLNKEKGSPVVVFRSTRSLVAGEVLGAHIESVTLPGDSLFPNLLKEAPTGEMAQFVAETPLVENIRTGEIVLYRHLEATVDAGLRGNIPSGMKAVSVEVDETTSVSFLVQPGDTVDVLAAMPRLGAATMGLPTSEVAERNPELTLQTRPLFQAVQVLAVGSRFRRTDPGRRESYGAVTLLVSMEEAQKLTFVRDVLRSPMTLVLRSPEDKGKQAEIRPLGVDSPEFDVIGNR